MNENLRTRSEGFTLLEAVIAIAIFSMAATAVYAWVNANLMTLERANKIYLRSSAIESAVELMSTIDIVSQPKGSDGFGDLRVDWVGTPSSYVSDVLNTQNAVTINQAQLYVVAVDIFLGNELIYRFEMSLLGVRKVRNIEDVIFG